MTKNSSYEAQYRGDRGAYDRYLQGMDASMRQKVALTAAHLLCQGHIADMGMGSGAGSYALAVLYPGLTITGVDVSQTMVDLARARYREEALPNLHFLRGDISEKCFVDGSLSGIFNSSVLHHVTSFSGYDHDAARRALSVQVDALGEEGVMIVRDFLCPGDRQVWLDLPDSAELFVRFSKEFRPLHPDPSQRGFSYEEVPGSTEFPVASGWRRFLVSHKHAVEFLLRKDYLSDWNTEILEEYTYFNQDRFEEVFSSLGLRVTASTPIRNPWIVKHRFQGQFILRSDQGQLLETPATNYIIVGERVAKGQGVRLREGDPQKPLGFLHLEHYQDLRTGRVRDLVRRPNLTVDILPWFELDSDVFVLCRKSFPRPILQARMNSGEERIVSLDEGRLSGYVTEPLSVMQEDKPLCQTVEEALLERASIGADEILEFSDGGRYFPSPGGVQEEVRSLLVQVTPLFVQRNIKNVSELSGSGLIRAIEIQQLIRAAQVGGLPNARLEGCAYTLLRRLGREPGPWIGEEIQLREAQGILAQPLERLLAGPSRRVFRKTTPRESPGFLTLFCSQFEEVNADGDVIGKRVLEYVAPQKLSCNTIAVALLARLSGGEITIGLDDDDLPAAQCFTGHSQLLVAPAYRLPMSVMTLSQARIWVRQQVEAMYGVTLGDIFELGGRYHPSPGVTPEAVYPMAAEVLREVVDHKGERLHFVPLSDAVSHLDQANLLDGHLRTVALRAAHALSSLGLLSAAHG